MNKKMEQTGERFRPTILVDRQTGSHPNKEEHESNAPFGHRLQLFRSCEQNLRLCALGQQQISSVGSQKDIHSTSNVLTASSRHYAHSLVGEDLEVAVEQGKVDANELALIQKRASEHAIWLAREKVQARLNNTNQIDRDEGIDI